MNKLLIIFVTAKKFPVSSIRVKKLLNPKTNDLFIIKIILTLSLPLSNDCYSELKKSLIYT